MNNGKQMIVIFSFNFEKTGQTSQERYNFVIRNPNGLKADYGRQKSTNSREERAINMISKKKFGTTVTAFGVAAGMLLSSAAPAHAEETAKTVQETQKEQADAPSTQSETENGERRKNRLLRL